jgi:Mn2+/Fe2+ NRAMP family transporter
MIALLRRLRHSPTVKDLGPGLITGAADDDPSGIATYSQAGAQFGFNMLWTVVLTYPLMVGIQMVSARLGCITGHGLAANIKQHLPRSVLYGIVSLLLIANTINIAADIAAMGQATKLLLGGSAHLYSVTFGIICLVLQIFLQYQTYVQYLKWLTVSLLAYVAVAFSIHVPWLEVMQSLVYPQPSLDSATLTVIVAVFGTTISPYLFFWQAAQEVEDLRGVPGGPDLPHALEQARAHLLRIRRDTYIGMGFSNLVAFFIILSTAATLHMAGITHIDTAAQAAEALRPVAGDFTFLLFSLGIIGTGMLAVPVLAGSAAYAVAETFHWRTGLNLRLEDGKEFYAIISFATLGGVALNFTRINAIEALFWSAVINGVIAVPIMAVMMYLGAQPSVLGDFVIRKRLKRLGWLATAVMALAVLAMFVTMLL